MFIFTYCPGKILELVKKSILDLSQIRFFILDEADRLLETVGIPSLLELYGYLPPGGSGINRLQVGGGETYFK